ASLLHPGFYLSFQQEIGVCKRRTPQIRVKKSYQFPDRPGTISFSTAPNDGKSGRIASRDYIRHSSNRPDPTQAEWRRTSAHPSVRGKANSEIAGSATGSTRKAVGHFKDKHRRISRRNRLLDQPYPGPGLFIFSTQGETTH